MFRFADFFLNADDPRGYWLTRLLLERGIGLVCLVAFVVALNQFKPLLGERGLLPVPIFVKEVAFRESPSLFFFAARDWAFTAAAWVGIALSLLVITGASSKATWISVSVWAAIYILYLSFVNVGQTFYAFGWESILLECCFFAMFLGGAKTVPQFIPILFFRWLLFRIMFGAGLIKLRGDSCWRDLTCLNYFYETQPMPNPLSWYFHWAPQWVNKGGVLFNHFAELIVPFAYFLPQPFAGIAGIITILFQLSIIITGNLSWLNWMTLVLAFSLLDAKFASSIVELRWPVMHAPAISSVAMHAIAAVAVVCMSVPVVVNMLSARQIMNTSFNSLHLVGTYGAFGSITRPRYEVIVEGTADQVLTPETVWKEYEFKAKPGDISRMPPQIAPYHLRLDWLMWFAAMGSYQEYPWFVNLLAKFLQADPAVLSLISHDPFGGSRPTYIRASLYEYHFTAPSERNSGNWWKRRYIGEYFPVVSLQTPGFRRILIQEGWLETY